MMYDMGGIKNVSKYVIGKKKYLKQQLLKPVSDTECDVQLKVAPLERETEANQLKAFIDVSASYNLNLRLTIDPKTSESDQSEVSASAPLTDTHLINCILTAWYRLKCSQIRLDWRSAKQW